MAMTADVKMQIEAIKNPGNLNVLDFGETVLLVDGWKGSYIKKENILIDLGKIKHPKSLKDDFDPNNIKLIKVKRTNHLLIVNGGRIVRRFDTNNDEHLWARNDWLKDYDNAYSYATEETKKAIIPIGINGELMGIVLCMTVNNEDK